MNIVESDFLNVTSKEDLTELSDSENEKDVYEEIISKISYEVHKLEASGKMDDLQTGIITAPTNVRTKEGIIKIGQIKDTSNIVIILENVDLPENSKQSIKSIVEKSLVPESDVGTIEFIVNTDFPPNIDLKQEIKLNGPNIENSLEANVDNKDKAK